ncbi:MAG: tetratricopeptide repeat protein [Bacteroidota bacterium]
MWRKINILILCVLFIFSNALFSQSKVDSLKSLLKVLPEDTNKANTYLNLHVALHLEDPALGYGYLEKAIELSSALDFKPGQLRSLLDLGIHLDMRGEYDSALSLYQKTQLIANELEDRNGIMESLSGLCDVLTSLQRLNEVDSVAYLGIEMAKKTPVDSVEIGGFYMMLANTAFYRSQYEKSIEFDLKSLSYYKNNFKEQAASLKNIGGTYETLKNHEKAIEYYLQGLEIANQSYDSLRLQAKFHLELGTSNMNLKEFKVARSYYEKAMIYFKKVDDKRLQSMVNSHLGKIHAEKNEHEQAIQKLKLALKQIEEIKAPSNKAYISYEIGQAYLKNGDYLSAEEYYKQSKSLFDQLENSIMNTAVLNRLSDVYAAMDDYKKAYNYLVQVQSLIDSMSLATTEKNITEIEEKYQNEQKQKEIELLNAENQIATLEIQKQEDFRNYLIVAAFLLVVLIGVIYNRYQLKARANAKLTELDHLKTNFFTNISHEFRTPLTLILSPLQKLLQKNTDSETKEVLSVIHRNATVLTELTNQLLDLSKLEAGELNLHVAKQDFKTFIKVLVASFESLAVAQKVEFLPEVGEAPEEAYFDEDKVQKILHNLLSNAFKFTSTEGKVILKVIHKGEQLLIAISDTGEGISPSDQELIFKRFHQNKANESNTAGTGVGLTLSKELAVLHKGDLEVDSEPGNGATFTFSFPIHKSAYTNEQITKEASETSLSIEYLKPIQTNQETTDSDALEKIVLIVEDNPDLRSHMQSLLKEYYQVMESINGKAGIEDALNLVPDVVVTDLMMPEVDGVELCNTLKANEKTSHIPIIMLTAKADRDTKLDGLKKGADDFLTKPFDNEELLIRIQNLITQREKLQTKYGKTLRLEPSKITIDSPEEVFIKKALEIVDRNLSNSEFTVEAFQKEIGMSRMQLHRKLKALTNFSASEFIKDIRLQRAADLLATNGINVAEVAYSCGFNGVSYFTQCFTEKYGTNPSKYIKKVS